jgi:uncharacterized protein (TIGR03000 family)
MEGEGMWQLISRKQGVPRARNVNALVLLLALGALGLWPALAEAQLLPFAWDARPKILFRYGRGNWAFANYQRYYDPEQHKFFWGWPGDYYGIDYSQPPLMDSVPPVILLDISGGVGWNKRGHILVRVPTRDADVWFNDWHTPQKGHERSFDSAPLKVGEAAIYQIRARFAGPRPGQVIDRTRSVTVQAGQQAIVDFTGGDL